MKKKTLMITGASGFIGKNFIEKYKNEYNIIPISLKNKKVEDINFKEIDVILHLAALVHQMKGAPEEEYFKINTELTKDLAEKAKESGVKHFVFYSTVKVYGYDGDLYNHTKILTEDSPCNPIDPYGKSKYQAEEILRKMEDENFKVAIIRPPLVYGNGVKGNMESLIKLVKLLPILPFNYDKNRRTLISVDNLLKITNTIIKEEIIGTYIAIEGEPKSIKEIVEGIEKKLNKKRINIMIPKFIFKILCKLKPEMMTRLYGSLQFKNNINNNIKKELLND